MILKSIITVINMTLYLKKVTLKFLRSSVEVSVAELELLRERGTMI